MQIIAQHHKPTIQVLPAILSSWGFAGQTQQLDRIEGGKGKRWDGEGLGGGGGGERESRGQLGVLPNIHPKIF